VTPTHQGADMKKPVFSFLLASLLSTLVLTLVLVGCGGGDETTITSTGASLAEPAGDTQTAAEAQTIDEALVGVWGSEQGIELEFTSDGVFYLRFKGQEAESPYSVVDGKVSYIDFEPNKQGEHPSLLTEYAVEGDTLVWDSGENQLTFTRQP
jgi:hypothetical protein